MKFSDFHIIVNEINVRADDEVVVDAIIMATPEGGDALTFETISCLFNPNARDPLENQLIPAAGFDERVDPQTLEAAQEVFESWLEKGAPISEDEAFLHMEVDGVRLSIEDGMI